VIKKEFISVKISSKTLSFYKEILKEDNISIGDTVKVSSLDLQNGTSIKVTGLCFYCGKEKIISKKAYNSQTDNNKKKFTCSKSCSLLKSKETNLKKWGVENPFQSEEIKGKIKRSNIKKWGVENPQQSDIIKEKTLVTNLKRWGYKKPSMSDGVKSKVKQTNNTKFGFDYPAQSEDIKKKMLSSCYDRWGVYNFSKTDKFKEILYKRSFDKMIKKLKKHGELLDSNKSEYKIKCGKCSSEFLILYSLMYNRIMNGEIVCTECNPKNKPIKENELYDFISDNYDGEIVKNQRKLISNELDIYLPDLKLAFEFNGLYWHSDLYKSRNYHLNKTKECELNNVQLIHIWEDDWRYKRDIIKSIIINKLGKSISIYARKTKVKVVTNNNLVRDFLKENHLQGFVGSSVKLGLFYNDELVSIMTFGKLRKSLGQKSKTGTYELLRFCSKLNYSVVGGASKLLEYFNNNYQPIELISYSDSSRSSGDLYEKMGFKLSHETVSNYYWVVDGIRKHRFNYRKDKLIKDGQDSNKTETEIMYEKGYYRVFDSGSKKWIK
jgi:hypothetical protein